MVELKDESSNMLTSAEVTEGETVHIQNDCSAGEFYQLAFVNLSAETDDEMLTVNYKITPDESPADIERPYAG